jgi:enoyl-CoA hydratase/carnithine racemase
MCDVRVASRKAKFAEAFVKLGIVPGDGAAWFLPRIVGLSKAMEISLTGDTLDAEQALACGLVSQVVEPENLLTCARSLADRIAANPPHALRMTKRLIREGVRSDLPALLDLSASFQSIAHTTKDHAEALSAFFEKRKASYQGS